MARRRHCSPLRRPDASGKLRFVTDGRRLVSSFSAEVRGDIAAACHVSEAAVSAWATGTARPDYESALVLETKFGVRMQSWALPPSFSNPICESSAKLPESRADAAQ